MGADIKSLRVRIKSTDSTLHLTKAMGLVASSKIRKANIAMNKGREYTKAFDDAIRQLSSSMKCQKSPYLAKRESNRTKLIVIAGDRGLAGGYNVNVFRLTETLGECDIIPIGRKACERYGKEPNSSEHYSSEDALSLAKELCRGFEAGEYDRLGIVWTMYRSMMTQIPTVTWVLPIERSSEKSDSRIMFEPDEMTILNLAVPQYIAGKIVAALRESFASEVAARRMAMDSAGKNAQEMIDELQLDYNRARQSSITQEITEIVAGSGT